MIETDLLSPVPANVTPTAVPATRRDLTASIVEDGQWYAVRGLNDELIRLTHESFLSGIVQLAGRDCRDRIAANGLRSLHRHFPLEHYDALRRHVTKECRQHALRWTCDVVRQQLEVAGEFFVDHDIVLRIHLPMHVVAKTFTPEDQEMRERYHKRTPEYHTRMEKFDHAAWQYFKGTPSRGWIHGPHRDTWYGHSFGGINFWLAVDGVNQDNSMVFYPGTWNQPLAFDPGTMYIAPGQRLANPVIVTTETGKAIVFPSELLHSSVLNMSDETRIVISTRLNTQRPVFLKEAYWHHSRWLRGSAIARGAFHEVEDVEMVFGSAGDVPADPESPQQHRRIHVNQSLSPGEWKLACHTEVLREGQKLLIEFTNRTVLMLRVNGIPRALSPRCPHLGLELMDGHLDASGNQFCPGHGLYFDVASGQSPRCATYRAQSYQVIEDGGMLKLRIPDPRQPT